LQRGDAHERKMPLMQVAHGRDEGEIKEVALCHAQLGDGVNEADRRVSSVATHRDPLAALPHLAQTRHRQGLAAGVTGSH
jgi:hypothetical protein